MKKLIPLLALLSLLALPASASAATDNARSGDVRAALTYNCGSGTFTCTEMRFRVRRGPGNNVVLDQRITLSGNQPFGPGNPNGDSVRFANLDSDAEQEILVDLFTGGAHCCLIGFIYDYNGTSYNRTGRNWADPGYVLTNIDRRDRPEFRTGDKRFVTLYTSYVESRLPIQIWNYRGGRLKTVTRKFRNTVRRDRDAALRFYRTVRRAKGDVRGALAAYQADNYLLSRRTAARGWRVLRGLRRRGIVSTRYLRSLQRKLRQFGYAR
jgi:hypothetical protein